MIGIGQPGHIDQIKQANVGAVYRLIDTYGPFSRIALSKYAHLAPASITKIVRELMEAHLVGETEYQENGLRGRPLAWWWRRRPGIFSRCTSVTAVSRCRCANCPANWWWKIPSPCRRRLPCRCSRGSLPRWMHFLPAISVSWSDLRLSRSRCPALSTRRLVSYTACSGTMFAICRWGRSSAAISACRSICSMMVGSPLNGAASILYPVMQRCIQQQSLPDYSRRIQIQATRFSHHGTMPGAALVKDALYDGSLLLKLMQG